MEMVDKASYFINGPWRSALEAAAEVTGIHAKHVPWTQ